MLLGVETDDEGRDVDDLLSDTDVALKDENTSVVDRLGEAKLIDAGLEAALHEILDLEGKDVIELHAGLVQDTDTDKAANEGIAFEKTLGVLLVEGKKLTTAPWDISLSLLCKLLSSNTPDTVRPGDSTATKEPTPIGTNNKFTHRAARRILDRVSKTRQTSRLLRRPYSPTSFNSPSLEIRKVSPRSHST